MRRLPLTCFFVALAGWSATALAAGGSVRVEIKDPKGAPVADAVASLVPLDAPPALAPPAAPVVVTQAKKEFDPYVTAVVVGTAVTFPNHDTVQHHVFSQSPAKRFDIPLHKKNEEPKPVVFDKAGIVSLGCNIHDWMVAYVVVLATPHYAKSGADGLVPLAELPPGRYRLDVWHPRIKETVTRDITIAANDPAMQVVSVTLNPDRRLRRAPEAGAGSYK